MSIPEELEAFGEKMPDPKSTSSSSGSSKGSKKLHRTPAVARLTKIDSEDEEVEEEGH